MDNQFLSTPLLKQKKKINSARDMLQKDELIKGLQLKNNKLRTQIIKIQNVIDQQLKDEPQDKSKLRLSIMRSDQNHQTMAKQLSNAYKRIKMYEYEISKYEDSQAKVGAVQKIKQVEGIIQQKKAMTDRLKSKLQQQQKLINQNSKKLNNNNIQQELERKIKSLSDQVKFLRQRKKQQETKDQARQGNMKKQIQFIKKMESQLLTLGMSVEQIEQLKVKAVKKTQATSIVESNVSKNNINSKEQPIHIQEVIEERTIDNYRQLKSQIKLLQKMHSDYQKKIAQADLEKQKAILLNSDSRDRLLEVQDEIERLQRQILVQKGKVIPSNLKPLKPLRSVSSHYMGSQKQKKSMVKINTSINKSSKILTHMLKFDEVGMTSDKGQRFTDRNVLGKKILHSKIISFTVFINNQTGVIGGLHAVYSHKKGGQYVKKDRETRQQQYKQQKIVCGEGEWLKSVTGTLSQQDRLQSLYVITNRGQSKRFGQGKTTKKSFSLDIAPDQIPVCIFGSLLVFKQVGKPQYSIVEHFGIQINTQSSTKAENSYDMIDV